MLKIFYIFIILIKIYSVDSKIEHCQIGATNKCLGIDDSSRIDNGIAGQDAKLIETLILSTRNECFSACVEHEKCFMAIYGNIDQICKLYYNKSYQAIQSSSHTYFLWTCCNKNEQPKPKNHCPGFWQYKINYKSFNNYRKYDPIKNFTTDSFFGCLQACLDNELCGAINFYDLFENNKDPVPCELIMQFPSYDIQMNYNYKWTTYQWVCADDYELPNPPDICHTRQKQLPGYWTIEQKNVTIDFGIRNVLYFYTMNLDECLKNCEYFYDCEKPWYSKLLYLCVLEASISSCSNTLNASLNINITNYRYNSYVWQPCISYSLSNQYFNEFFNFVDSKYECREILDNNNIYIYPTLCGESPIENFNKSNLFKCNGKLNDDLNVFDPKFYCQNRQAYKVIQKIDNKYQVSNGYQSYWLFNVSDVNFPLVSSVTQCSLYNSNFNDLELSSLTFISRQKWFAEKSTQYEPLYPVNPVKYVIITSSELPACSAYSTFTCADKLRENDHNLRKLGFVAYPYNFIICGNGSIFEGKGWVYRSQAANKYNENSVSIALMGRYITPPRSDIITNTLKKLILYGVKIGKINKNYIIYSHNDITTKQKYKIINDGLENIIRLYPRYRGHLNKECSKITLISIIISTLGIVIITIFAIFITHFLIYKIIHDKFCNRLNKFRINTIYGKNVLYSKEILPQIILQKSTTLMKIGQLLSTITTNIYWINDKENFKFENITQKTNCKCKKAIYSLFDLYKFQSDLIDISTLFSISELKLCTHQFYVIFERHSAEGNDNIILCHMSNKNVFQHFLTKLYSKNCVCDYFYLEKYFSRIYEFEFVDVHGKLLNELVFRQNQFDNSINRENLMKKYCFINDVDGIEFY